MHAVVSIVAVVSLLKLALLLFPHLFLSIASEYSSLWRGRNLGHFLPRPNWRLFGGPFLWEEWDWVSLGVAATMQNLKPRNGRFTFKQLDQFMAHKRVETVTDAGPVNKLSQYSDLRCTVVRVAGLLRRMLKKTHAVIV